jgi:hypothetical protein
MGRLPPNPRRYTEMNTRNCECCRANYACGKAYGDYWCESNNPSKETKGLCEFCNPNCEKWYTSQKPCHAFEDSLKKE